MANISKAIFFMFVVSFSSYLLSPLCDAHLFQSCKINAIYNLGDSISDTGNLVRENPLGALTPFARLPYGETFLNGTGRCSNGLLIIDYLALAAGIPMIEPYLNKDGLFVNGVNFAVAGCTALSHHILSMHNISLPVTNSSLDIQLEWMSTFFRESCNNIDCRKKLKQSLFMVGEIGGNDYNYGLFQGRSIEEVKKMVPSVVQAIKDAVRKVIGFGATRIIVPGNFPIGCFPIYLTGFQTTDSTAYDEFHCLKSLNNFSMYHNKLLQEAIEELKQENPNTIIVYGDYYNAFQWMYSRAILLGFDATSIQRSCCGIGGDYNFNLVKMCGAPGVPVCSNPGNHISWDGIHLTQKAYGYMAKWLLHHIFPQLKCNA